MNTCEREPKLRLTAPPETHRLRVVQSTPTKRHIRILRNLALNNYIWEQARTSRLIQFDESSGKDSLLRLVEVKDMSAAGWIRRVQFPPEAQRLDRYEITEAGRAALDVPLKGPMPAVPERTTQRKRAS